MNRFSHRLVRDLAWVIASPPLISGNYNDTHWWSHENCLNEFNDCLPALLALDKDPSPLINHFETLKSKRLGLRFEHFIAYWLMISPNFEFIAQNIQIIEKMKKGSHTHGEIDFIVQDLQTKKIIHLEVSVKFYLGSKPYEDPYRWFGTNTNDQLGKKADHLKQHQTQLSKNFSGYLNNLVYSIDSKQCFFKGRLFYPQGIDAPPQNIADNHLLGRWTQSQIASSERRLFPLDKTDWLAQLSHDDLYQRSLKSKPPKNEKALCYVNATQGFKEIERVFYLPADFHFPNS